MERFITTVLIKAQTRYNYVTKAWDVIVPAYEAKIEITLDIDRVARSLGVKAESNASRTSKDAGGALVVKVKSPKPANVLPITDDHRAGARA